MNPICAVDVIFYSVVTTVINSYDHLLDIYVKVFNLDFQFSSVFKELKNVNREKVLHVSYEQKKYLYQ